MFRFYAALISSPMKSAPASKSRSDYGGSPGRKVSGYISAISSLLITSSRSPQDDTTSASGMQAIRAAVEYLFPVIVPLAHQLRARRARRRVCGAASRSEEHTSELQSLMRISYAVFCLKTKKQQKYQNQIRY